MGFSSVPRIDTRRPGSPRSETLFQKDVTIQTDGLIVTQLPVSRSLRTIWPSLRRMCCVTRNSQTAAHRSGVAASSPLPFGGHRTTTLRSHTLLACWKKDQPRASRVLERARVLVSSPLYFTALCFFYGSDAQRVHSSACALPLDGRESVLKKSASVVAKDSACMVTVLKCFSSASVFSRVFLMVSLKIVSASSVS